MNHCLLVMISSGRSPFSKNFTGCSIGFGSDASAPASASSPAISFCAGLARLPARWSYAAWAAAGSSDSNPGSPQRIGRSRPSGWITDRIGSPSSRRHITSVTSPNVQTMAIPVPFSGSASSCASTGTRAPNSGVATSPPSNSGRYRSSLGWATSATHAGISSGRVVSISTAPSPSARRNNTRYAAPGIVRSSSSACATAVRKSTSHSVGASTE